MNLIQVIEQIGREKGIEREVLIDAVGAAILSASRKTLGTVSDLRVDFDQASGRFVLYAVKTVVEEVTPLVPSPDDPQVVEELADMNRTVNSKNFRSTTTTHWNTATSYSRCSTSA